MSSSEFRHDWEPHYWRSNARQKWVGYRSCRNCGRGEWLSGDVQEGDRPEEVCEAENSLAWDRAQYIQGDLFGGAAL